MKIPCICSLSRSSVAHTTPLGVGYCVTFTTILTTPGTHGFMPVTKPPLTTTTVEPNCLQVLVKMQNQKLKQSPFSQTTRGERFLPVPAKGMQGKVAQRDWVKTTYRVEAAVMVLVVRALGWNWKAREKQVKRRKNCQHMGMKPTLRGCLHSMAFTSNFNPTAAGREVENSSSVPQAEHVT